MEEKVTRIKTCQTLTSLLIISIAKKTDLNTSITTRIVTFLTVQDDNSVGAGVKRLNTGAIELKDVEGVDTCETVATDLVVLAASGTDI